MSNTFSGDGNLGAAPKLRTVMVGNEKRSVADFRVAIDNYVTKGEGEYEEKGSFWLNATLWGPRAERAMAQLVKGARVHIVGRLVLETWEDKESGEPREALRLHADDIYLSTVRIETVTFKEKEKKVA